MERISFTGLRAADEMKQLFREGRFLLSQEAIEIDGALFRKLLEELVQTVVRIFPRLSCLEQVLSLEALQGRELDRFLSESSRFDSDQLQDYIKKEQWLTGNGGGRGAGLVYYFCSVDPFLHCLCPASRRRGRPWPCGERVSVRYAAGAP